MILERGNMWDVFGKTGLFVITTNPIVRKDGCCVMGRGIAKEAATRFPEIQSDLGCAIQQMNEMECNSFGPLAKYDGQQMAYFMVKSHWKYPAELSIIEDSLMDMVLAYEAHRTWGRIDINFPGIGNGKLKREQVLPLLEKYLKSDNYHVWEY